MTKIFEDDPYEQWLWMQQRIETLERINNEIVHHLKITTDHLDNVGKSVNQLQKDQVAILHQLHHLNTNGGKHGKTSSNT